MGPIRKPGLLVDARHGDRMDHFHRNALRRGAAFPASVVHYEGDKEPESTFLLIERLHRILLAVSTLTVLGAVAGSHGMVF